MTLNVMLFLDDEFLDYIDDTLRMHGKHENVIDKRTDRWADGHEGDHP